ncbi:hypothetical protein AB0F42_09260 [Streptomyces buecherae]|uniref:hypothetical protein n=1 Tax=Streptomyces buecherae TaxID=2763006 RepID=UPI0033E6A473
MNRTTTAAALLAALLTVGLTACGGDDGEPKSIDAAIPPKPNADDQAYYIRALRAISPSLAEDEDGAVSRGRTTCGTILTYPDDRSKQLSAAREQFGGVTQLTDERVEEVLDTVHGHLCANK